jgi:16S rRNA (cytosine967-C5)-methyltransferase
LLLKGDLLVNLRLVAAKIIFRVINQGQSLTSVLDKSLSKVPVVKDRALIQAICYGTLRHYFRLDFILNQLLHKPLKDEEIKMLALIGLYQLKYMRVKEHAAVSETVAAASKKPWAKGLLNAVLRNYQRKHSDLDALAEKDKVASCSHPDWMIDLLTTDWPQFADKILAENNQQPPMALRVNQRLCSRETYVERLRETDISAVVSPVCSSAIVLESPVSIERLPDFMSGFVSVQDTAAQLAAGLLNVKPGHRVLDVCAAPGGKTAHILELQAELKKLIAVDVDADRLLNVTENLQRLKLQADCIVGDAMQTSQWWDGEQFDRILLDSPCSATGVIRRHPDIKLLRRKDDIGKLRQVQKSILDAIWPLLKPGGVLLYVTCSILKQENEQQISAFFSRTEDVSELPIDSNWGIEQQYGRQILTGENGMDGFYYACLKKN